MCFTEDDDDYDEEEKEEEVEEEGLESMMEKEDDGSREWMSNCVEGAVHSLEEMMDDEAVVHNGSHEQGGMDCNGEIAKEYVQARLEAATTDEIHKKVTSN